MCACAGYRSHWLRYSGGRDRAGGRRHAEYNKACGESQSWLGIFSSTAFVSVIEVVFASCSTVYITGRSRAFIPFMCRVIMCVAKIIVETEAFLVDGVQRACWDVARHGPALHRPSGTISSTAWHLFFNNFHRAGESKRGVAFPQSA